MKEINNYRFLSIILAKLLLHGEIMNYDLYDSISKKIKLPVSISYQPYQ